MLCIFVLMCLGEIIICSIHTVSLLLQVRWVSIYIFTVPAVVGGDLLAEWWLTQKILLTCCLDINQF